VNLSGGFSSQKSPPFLIRALGIAPGPPPSDCQNGDLPKIEALLLPESFETLSGGALLLPGAAAHFFGPDLCNQRQGPACCAVLFSLTAQKQNGGPAHQVPPSLF
jgi:hypothetical protein